jgi:hypothetical protein
MSLEEFTTDAPLLVRFSDVESERFGYNFSRCTVPISSSTQPSDIARAIEAANADITVLRFSSVNVTWFDQLARHLEDHVLLYGDCLVYWGLTAGGGRLPSPAREYQVAAATDEQTIGDLVARTFANYVGHYRANSLLSRAAAEAGYRDWALRTALSDSLVLHREARPIGIATTTSTPDHLEVLLAGIVPDERGRGAYSHLLRGVEIRTTDALLPRVVISTQSHNIGVQRAWARYGFLPIASITTIHVVKRNVWESHQT